MKKWNLTKLAVFLIAVFFISCSTSGTRLISESELRIFPAPPDTTRIQYLTSFSSSIDITGQRTGLMKYILGEKQGDPIVKPYGIAIYKGRIYICDSIIGGLEILDLNQKTFDYFKPSGLGLIKKPINCSVDEQGLLYVADANRKQIIVFNQNLKYVAAFGDAMESKPTDVVVKNDTIWFCDMRQHKIHVYTKNGFRHLFSFPDAETDDPQFLNQPINLTVSSNRIYVSDFGAFKIKVFNKKGEYIKSIGSFGRGLGQFVRPKGIAVDKNNILYVVDSGFENVQMFNSEGQLMMFFGGSYSQPGDMWLPAKVMVDYNNLKYFQKYVHSSFNLKYLIFVTNQYGPDKISVYGFVEPKITIQ